MTKINTTTLSKIAVEAGNKILEIYNSDDFDVKKKADQSPVTKADIIANDYICEELKKIYADIPVLSEERKALNFNERKDWTECFIVDPIDGTKEFIKRNGEFTVNIAYVKNGKVLDGVVYAPATDLLYYTEDGSSFKRHGDQTWKLPCDKTQNYSVVISRSHPNEDTQNFIDDLKEKHRDLKLVSKGSSLKLCMIAEGSADIYPRLGPTMEWDIAAAHAVIKGSGGNVKILGTDEELSYNRENLLNPYFVATR